MPDSRADEYLAKARLADDQAAIAPTKNLARQWRALADTDRIIADALRCPGLRSRTIKSGTEEHGSARPGYPVRSNLTAAGNSYLPTRQRHRYIAAVTDYRIVRNGATGDYGVEVSSPGRFRSLNGFHTERDAQDWIEQERLNEAAAGHILQM